LSPARRRFPWSRLTAAAACAWLIASGCSPGENAVTNPGSGRTGLLALPETLRIVLPDSGAIAADLAFPAEVSTGASPVLRLARSDSVESVAYVRFGNIPDTVGLTSVRLGLRVRRGSGEQVQIVAHEVLEDWTEASLRWGNRPETADSSLSSGPSHDPGGIQDTVLLTQEIPSDLVRRWKRDPDSNHGLALSLSAPAEVQVLAREAIFFDSLGIANPTLRLLTGNGTVIGEAGAAADAFAYDDTRTLATGADTVLALSEWLPTRVALRFPLPDSLLEGERARGLLVNLAVLRLSVVSATEEAAFLNVLGATGDWAETAAPDSIPVSGLYGRVELPASVDSVAATLSVGMGGIVQRWIDGTANQGIVLALSGEGGGAARLEVRSSEAEPALRPVLEIVYTRPLTPRWAVEESQ
jgi:hypothetical protein